MENALKTVTRKEIIENSIPPAIIMTLTEKLWMKRSKEDIPMSKLAPVPFFGISIIALLIFPTLSPTIMLETIMPTKAKSMKMTNEIIIIFLFLLKNPSSISFIIICYPITHNYNCLLKFDEKHDLENFYNLWDENNFLTWYRLSVII